MPAKSAELQAAARQTGFRSRAHQLLRTGVAGGRAHGDDQETRDAVGDSELAGVASDEHYIAERQRQKHVHGAS